jgi:hypothetical protein
MIVAHYDSLEMKVFVKLEIIYWISDSLFHKGSLSNHRKVLDDLGDGYEGNPRYLS